ncbi:hypothetical protein MTO96_004957 [Rhipicephalus appendiculatus]
MRRLLRFMNVSRLLSLLTAVSIAAAMPPPRKNTERSNVCSTDVCKARAKLIKKSLNTSVDPCNDFYSYACGGWIRNNTLPPSASSYGVFDIMEAESLQTLKGALENITEVNETQLVIRNAAVVYNACKAVPGESDRPDILLNILNASGFAQWPLTNTSSKNFTSVSEVLRVTGLDPILTFYVYRDAQDLSSYVIQIDEVTFPKLGRNQLINPYSKENENMTDAYKKLIEVAVKFVNPNITDVELATLVCNVLFLERELANMTSPPEDRRNPREIYHRTTISEMQCNFTNIPLLDLLNKEFSRANMTLNSSEILELYALDYYQKLNDYICGINPAEAKKEVTSYVNNITEVFRDELNKTTWMDNKKTRDAALDKTKMGSKIGYPEEILNMTYLLERYEYKCWLYIEDNNERKTYEKLRLPYDNTSWVASAAEVNAFYNPSNNEMLYPSAILQRPFYETGLPSAVNYGSMGTTIGHEISHGFDDQGSQYDGDGRLHDWWSNETLEKFLRKSECFEYQYGNITDNTTGMRAFALLRDDTRLEGLNNISGEKAFLYSHMRWLACLLTAVSFVVSKPTRKNTIDGFTVCNSTVCKARAKLINESLNTSVDPCDDFYSYVCGGWIRNHTLPPSASSYGIFDVLDYELKYTLKEVLENMTDVTNETVIKNAAVVYNACVAISTSPDRPDILLDILNASGFSNWPITAMSSSWLHNVSQTLEVTGMNPILSLYISRDVQELNSNVIQLDQARFMRLGRNQLLDPYSDNNKKITEAYKKLLEVVIKFVRPNITEAELLTVVCDIMVLERELANLTASPEERRNTFEIYHRTTISELECNYTNIPLLKLLNKEFSKANITVNDNETLEMYGLSYYKKLNELLPNINPVTLYNYAGARTALSWAADLSSGYRNASFELSKVAWGVHSEVERWTRCISFLGGGLQHVIDYLYVRKKFTIQAKQQVEEYVGNIKDVFRKELQNSSWMDKNTREAAVTKLDKMGLKIGYPDHIMNMTFLQESYKYVPELNSSLHFTQMWIYISYNNKIKWLQKLRLPYDPNSWVVRAAVVNAFYNPDTNDMLYPSAILQGLFYQHGLPSSINYGSLGSIIGHEITHGFDDEGSQYNAEGRLQDWWSNATRSTFTKKADCFVKQYGNITDRRANMTLNGRNTVGENIADNGGVRMAFKAFTDLKEDIRLEGLTHIPGKQMFFIAHSMVWCKLTTEASLRMMIQYDPHSPTQYRQVGFHSK